MHDPELPAGFQDADFEQRDLESLGRRLTQLKRAGICTHGWTKGQPGPEDRGPITCLDCGAIFATPDDLYQARARYL